MKHVMQDLETIGTDPGCAIVSIGAVVFNTTSGLVSSSFYAVVSRSSCAEVGLYEDPDTITQFWDRQPESVQATFREATHDGEHIVAVLLRYRSWWAENAGAEGRAWGNGSDFDNSILGYASKAAGVGRIWGPHMGRCYRTIKNLHRGFRIERLGEAHNALDDARSQAQHLVQLGWALKLQFS